MIFRPSQEKTPSGQPAKCTKKQLLDGVCPLWLSLLPYEAHARLAEMLHAFERQGAWRETTCHWKIIALPKKRQGTLPSLDEVRALSIGHLASSGGIGGEDVSPLLLTVDIDLDPASCPCLMALNFSKAFDSCDYNLSLAVLSRLSLPARVVNLLGAQW